MDASRHRAAAAAPSGPASRCSPRYLRAWRASRTSPPYGAHHSSWTRGSGTSDGIPMRVPAGSPSRARERTPARAAQRGPLAPASDADRREREVEQPAGHRAGSGDTESNDAHDAEGWPAPLTCRLPAAHRPAQSAARASASPEHDYVPNDRPGRGDGPGRQLEAAVRAPGPPDDARPRAQRGPHRHDAARAASAAGRPRKTASIGKRMKSMWMLDAGRSQSPAPGRETAGPSGP